MKTVALFGSFLLVFGIMAALPPRADAQRSPALQASHVAPEVLSQACGPQATTTLPNVSLTITGGQDTQRRQSFAQGEFVTLNAGANQGLQIGQEFFVRRLIAPKGVPMGPANPGVTHTAGWVKVYAVDEDLSLATITFNCDALEVGDYLEPLALPTPIKVAPATGKPERVYGRILLGQDRRAEFGTGDYFILDRGTMEGVAPGAHFVVYRWKKKLPENFLAAIAEAVVVDAQDHTARLRLTSARDAVTVNDLAAMRK